MADGKTAGSHSRVYDGYIRVSEVGERDVEGEEYRTEDQQRTPIQKWSEFRHVTIGHWEIDRSVSGTKVHRPGLDAILERIRTGEVDGIAVAYLSRLSRLGPADAMHLVERIHSYGGQIAVMDLGIDPTTKAGELFMTIMLALARWESRERGSRFRQSREDAIRRGVYISNTCPFGYLRVDRDGKPVGLHHKAARLLIHPVWGPIATEIFKRRVAGESWYAIANWLTEIEAPPPSRRRKQWLDDTETGRRQRVTVEPESASRWSQRQVMRLVAMPIYKGQIVDRHRGGGEVNDPIVRAVPELALVDEATWKAAQQRRGPRGGERPTSTQLLAGLVRCGLCRHAMSSHAKLGDLGPTYRCRRVTEGCPHGPQISARTRQPNRPKVDRAMEIIEQVTEAGEKLGLAPGSRPVRDEIHARAADEGISKRTVKWARELKRQGKSAQNRPGVEGLDEYVIRKMKERMRLAIEVEAFEVEDPLARLRAELEDAKQARDAYATDVEIAEAIGRESYLAGCRTRRERVEKLESELDRQTAVTVVNPARGLDPRLLDFEEVPLDAQRRLMASMIQAVFVGPPRSGYGASDDRVEIVWFDDVLPEIPVQGRKGVYGPLPRFEVDLPADAGVLAA